MVGLYTPFGCFFLPGIQTILRGFEPPDLLLLVAISGCVEVGQGFRMNEGFYFKTTGVQLWTAGTNYGFDTGTTDYIGGDSRALEEFFPDK